MDSDARLSIATVLLYLVIGVHAQQLSTSELVDGVLGALALRGDEVAATYLRQLDARHGEPMPDGVQWFEGRADVTVAYGTGPVQPVAPEPEAASLDMPLPAPAPAVLDPIVARYGGLYVGSDTDAPSLSLCFHAVRGTEAAAHYALTARFVPVRGLLLQPSAFPSVADETQHGLVSAFSNRGMPLLILAPSFLPEDACLRVNGAAAATAAADSVAAAAGEVAVSPARYSAGSSNSGGGGGGGGDMVRAASTTSVERVSAFRPGPPRAEVRAAAAGGTCTVSALGAAARFADEREARAAFMVELTAGVAEAFAAAQAAEAPQPEALEGNGSSLRRRSLYVAPTASRGVRSVLAVKYLFRGQAASLLPSDAELSGMMAAAVAELNRAAMGAATWSYTMPAQAVSLSASTAPCTQDLNLLDSDGRATLQAQLGIDSTSFRHLVMLLPSCAGYTWAGISNTPGEWTALNGPSAAMVRTAVHELGHAVGLLHASFLDPVSGAWAEYLDSGDFMSSCDPDTGACNNYAQRDFGSGYKRDLGWLPASRVLTFGPLARVGDVSAAAAPVTLQLGASDSGDLARSPAAPLSVRLRHPATLMGFAGERYMYLSYRHRAANAPLGLALNDVPHGAYTAGNSRVIDSTPFTATQGDSPVDPGEAWVQAAADGAYLLENTRVTRQPAASSDSVDNSIALRVSKLAPGSNLPPQGLGCYGATCQPAPSDATPIALPCVSNPSASVTLQVAVTDSGMSYPAVFAVGVPSLSNAPGGAVAVTARLCVPPGATGRMASFTEPPLAEVLAGSPLERGNAPDTSAPVLTAAGWDAACRSVSFFVRGSSGPRYLAALAQSTTASSTPGAPATLTMTCAAAASGAATAYGVPADAVSRTTATIAFSNGAFSGDYAVDASQPYANGALQWVAAGRYRIRYGTDGQWALLTATGTGYYAKQADQGRDLAVLTSFGSMIMTFSRRCPAHSFLYTPSGGCLACPPNSASRGTGALNSAAGSVASVCTCGPGYFMTSGSGPSSCAPCAPGQYKDTPGNSPSDATFGCKACPAGFMSASGSVACVPASPVPGSAGGTTSGADGYAWCSRYSIVGWRAGWNGVYTLDTTTAAGSSTTVRDGFGEGRAVYALAGSPHMLVVDASRGMTFFTDSRDASSYMLYVPSYRPPQAWGGLEWTVSYPTASAACVCAAYGSTTADGGCICPAGQTAVASGRCADIPGASAANSCASNNGGCSDTCTATAGGPVCSCSKAGCGVDAATRSTCAPCADDAFVDAAHGGVCTPCPGAASGQRRTVAGTSCGCPLGWVLTAASVCAPPRSLHVDVWSPSAGSTALTPASPVGAHGLAKSPFRGRFAACQPPPGSGIASADDAAAKRVWQLVTQLPGSVAPSAPLYVVYEPAGGGSAAGWSIYSGGMGPAPATPRYAYTNAADFNLSSAWPASVGSGAGSVATAAGGMIPAGIQPWHVFTPHPSGFAPAWLAVRTSAFGAGPLSSLPVCGAATAASADAAPSSTGTGTLGSGPGSPGWSPGPNGGDGSTDGGGGGGDGSAGAASSAAAAGFSRGGVVAAAAAAWLAIAATALPARITP